jgi:hypothetical protein
MNDFTKEELKELMHCVYVYRDLCDEGVEDNLCYKLKSMIDNYCERKCDHEFKLCKSFYGNTECKYRCTECLKSYDEVINDNQ